MGTVRESFVMAHTSEATFCFCWISMKTQMEVASKEDLQYIFILRFQYERDFWWIIYVSILINLNYMYSVVLTSQF